MTSSQTAIIYSYVLYLIGICDFGIDKSAMRQAVAEFFFMAALTGGTRVRQKRGSNLTSRISAASRRAQDYLGRLARDGRHGAGQGLLGYHASERARDIRRAKPVALRLSGSADRAGCARSVWPDQDRQPCRSRGQRDEVGLGATSPLSARLSSRPSTSPKRRMSTRSPISLPWNGPRISRSARSHPPTMLRLSMPSSSGKERDADVFLARPSLSVVGAGLRGVPEGAPCQDGTCHPACLGRVVSRLYEPVAPVSVRRATGRDGLVGSGRSLANGPASRSA